MSPLFETTPRRSLLAAIATDLEAGHSSRSLEGHDRARWTNVEALATQHGAGRAREEFTVTQLVPEFPALRFSASHLWLGAREDLTTEDVADLVRFDEAIDFALTRSVDEFMERLNRSRETFLGVLGHDLRDPLSTMITGARLLHEPDIDEPTRRDVAGRIAATGERMQQLVADLLDFTQARLGRMPIERREADLARVVRAVADEFASSHPDRPIRLDVSGDVSGRWDAQRVSQAVGNLLGNALHHGAAASPIDVSAKADEAEATIVVHNEGPAIPAEKQPHLFEPLSASQIEQGRYASRQTSRTRSVHHEGDCDRSRRSHRRGLEPHARDDVHGPSSAACRRGHGRRSGPPLGDVGDRRRVGPVARSVFPLLAAMAASLPGVTFSSSLRETAGSNRVVLIPHPQREHGRQHKRYAADAAAHRSRAHRRSAPR